ncbi:TIGR00153 family protein [Imhoffiella purpurea]|uniref:Phosphate transport regulator n=1 Tax=Imhoffiella purpurea TaxID=1249627 RepID=W9W014_9GAMM|nr:TIGR00153 family protein [Imhoffiella purpurea]EXJ15960.1 Phosphate transport regulator [Imhoffiella purpurea]
MKSTNPIAALFGRSPFKPMQQHMRLVTDCIDRLPPLFDAAIEADGERLTEIGGEIKDLERSADALKHQIRQQLPRGLFMPVDRRDLLDLLDRQDLIADTANDIAGLLLQRPMPIPAPMRDGLRDLVATSTGACQEAMGIIDELDELVETGFRGPEANRVEQMAERLRQSGQRAETLTIGLARTLFQLEDGLEPVTVVFLYQLVQWIGQLADDAEKAGDQLVLLIAR